MIETLNDVIMSGLKAEHAHSDPLSILEDLTPTKARKKAPGYDHSCWDLLYHTVIWNDIFLNNIKGLVQNWKPEDNWPQPDVTAVDDNFYKLVQRFRDNLQEVKNLLTNSDIDFNANHRISTHETTELSTLTLFITILQHISYHSGQIACVKKMVNS